ncbi:hypothetical protein BDY24DRAFT_413368 [Mrakia frigida]|uniref:uncharacterized protein n=1 Tax=Mrakia frigida TaxID=29902 RepID=UPI003FCC268F
MLWHPVAYIIACMPLGIAAFVAATTLRSMYAKHLLVLRSFHRPSRRPSLSLHSPDSSSRIKRVCRRGSFALLTARGEHSSAFRLTTRSRRSLFASSFDGVPL